MIKVFNSPELLKLFIDFLAEVHKHLDRLEQTGQALGDGWSLTAARLKVALEADIAALIPDGQEIDKQDQIYTEVSTAAEQLLEALAGRSGSQHGS